MQFGSELTHDEWEQMLDEEQELAEIIEAYDHQAKMALPEPVEFSASSGFRVIIGNKVHHFADFEEALALADKHHKPIYNDDNDLVATPCWMKNGNAHLNEYVRGARYNGMVHAHGSPI